MEYNNQLIDFLFLTTNVLQKNRIKFPIFRLNFESGVPAISTLGRFRYWANGTVQSHKCYWSLPIENVVVVVSLARSLTGSVLLPKSLIQKECGADAKKSMQFFISKAAGKAIVDWSEPADWLGSDVK